VPPGLRRLCFTLLLAFAALFGLAPSAGAALLKGFVGLTSEDVFARSANYRTSNLSSQASIGVQLHRQTFDWSAIEKSEGQYDLSYYDAYVAAAAAHGIRILPILFNPPAFHLGRTHHRATCPPRSNASFAAFARILVRRYGPKGSLWRERPKLPRVPITAWQIWNEPNLPQFYWCGTANVRQYVAMLRTVGAAIKQVDRRAEIVTAGLPPSKLSGAVPLAKFISQMYRAGGKRAFDSLAINSYAKDQRELGRLLASVRRLMNRRGDRRGSIWITELGWGDKGLRHRFIVGAKGQASRITRSFALIRRERRRLRLRGVVYFCWRDADPYPPRYQNLWGLHTGLLNKDGTPKRAFFAFKRAVGRLR
jgi:polysaccharide biosynthesis protein PslG